MLPKQIILLHFQNIRVQKDFDKDIEIINDCASWKEKICED